MVLESNTLDVLFVKDGQQGEDGKVLYTWIKYAKDANGTGMTDDPNGAIYIGISYNNESSIESNDPTQYAWTKIQGADGKKGEDAYTIFLENENISFATDENRNPLSEQAYTSGITIMKGAKPVTDFAIGDIAKTQGIAVAKTNTAIAISVVNGNPLPNDSGEIEIPITVGGTVFKKILTWTCAKKGDQGEQGPQGGQGIQGEKGKDGTSVTITNKSITYQLSTSGTTIPTGTWQTSPQTIPEGQYQWTKISVTYSDGNKTESYSISYRGKNGSDGTSVKTTSTSVKYQVGDSGTTKPTGTWQNSVPTVAQGKYLWTQTIVNYSDGNSTESYSVSYRGIDGSNGVNGMNAATIYLYQRATSTPSKPSNTLTYTFSTTKITGTLNNGWSTAIPTGTDAVYVTVASVSSKNDTTTIATSAWSAPVVLAQNGKSGSDGKAGLNVATIYLYQRATSKPSKPSASVTYTFSTGMASGLNNGWTQEIPDGTNPLYVTLATASSNTATDTILSSEWSDVVVMAQNGEDGQDGISPKVSLSKTGDTTTISIIDATGTHTQTVKDGTNGTPGAAGKDGKTSYFHVKYSNDGGKTFTGNSGEDTGIYMGSYTDYTDGDSTDVSKYTWVRVEGEDGAGFHWNLVKGTDTPKEFQPYSGVNVGCTFYEIDFRDKTINSDDKFAISFDFEWTQFTQNNNGTFDWWFQGAVNKSWDEGNPFTYIVGQVVKKNMSKITDGAGSYHVECCTSGIESKLYDFGVRFDNSDGTGKVKISNFKLEEGDKPSPWCTTYEETLAKNLIITPSSQYFKSTDGGKTFAPNAITIKPTIQGEISFGKWQYSIDGGVSFADVMSGQKGLMISNNVLTVSKDSSLYSDAVTMVTFRAVASDSSFYDTCSIAKIYDVSDIGDGRNLLWNSNFAKTDETINTSTYTTWGLILRGSTYTATIDTSVKHNNFNTLKVIGTKAGENGGQDLIYRIKGLNLDEVKFTEIDVKYTLSFYAKASIACNFSARYSYDSYAKDTNVALSTDWKRYEIQMHPTTASYQTSLIFKMDAASTVWFSEFKLEKGSSATGYSTAPEDLQTAILSTKSEISDVSLKVDKNKQAIEQRVEKTTYQQDLNLVKGDISKANEGLNKWRYEIYPKSLFTSEYQSKYTMDVFAKNKNLTPSQSVLLDDASLSTGMNYGDSYIAYGLTFIKMSAAKSVTTTLYNDDGASFYVNGKQIISNRGSYTAGVSITFNLTKGWNCLEIVLNEIDGREGFKFAQTLSKLSECQLMNCYYGTPVARQSHITNQLVQNTTDIDGVSGSVQKVMSTVGGSGKIDEFVNNYSTWKKKVDGIETRVGETYTTKSDFNGLEIGGKNLLTKDDCDMSKWQNLYPAHCKVTNNDYSNHIDYVPTGGEWEIIYKEISVTKGQKYILSFDYKVNKAYNYLSGQKYGVYLSTSMPTNAAPTNIITDGQYVIENTVTGLKRGVITFTAPIDTLYIVINGGCIDDNQTGLSFEFNKWKLEKGNKATDWTPAFEDNEINGQNLVSNLPSNWEQGGINGGQAVGSTYASIKSSTTYRIRIKDIFSVSYNITISAGGTTTNSAKEILSFYGTLYDTKKGLLRETGWKSFPSTINCGDAKYMSIILRWGDGTKTQITPSDISQICLKIERGTSATPFTLAPEDINGKIVNVETIANQTAKKFEWIVKGESTSSNLVLTDNALTAIANNINLTGKVTFSWLNNETQKKITDANTWVTNNGSSTTSLNSMVKKWTDGAVSDTTQINGGWIKANTITASKIAVGDFTNYADINESNTYGFTVEKTADGVWFSKDGSKLGRDNYISKMYSCEPGQTFYVEYDISNTIKDSTEYKAAGTMLFGCDGTQTVKWYQRRGAVVGTAAGTVTHMSQQLTMPSGTRFFYVVLQIEGHPPFTGTLKIRNLSVRKAVTGAVIVDGSITADKIATDAIKSRNYISSGGTQGSFLNLSDGSFTSPNLSWDANGNLIAKNANLSGQITATKGTVGGWNIEPDALYKGKGNFSAGIPSYVRTNAWHKDGSAYKIAYLNKQDGGMFDISSFGSGSISSFTSGSYLANYHDGDVNLTNIPEYYTQSFELGQNIVIAKSVFNPEKTLSNYSSQTFHPNQRQMVTLAENRLEFEHEYTDYGTTDFSQPYVLLSSIAQNGEGIIYSSNGLTTITSEYGVYIKSWDTSTYKAIETDGSIYSNQEIQCGGSQMRIIGGNYGILLRNDGSNFYILSTDSGNQWGGWNSKRPFRINLANGIPYFEYGIIIPNENYLIGNGYQIARGTSWGGVCIGDDSKGLRFYGTSIWASHSISTSDENLKENFTTLDQYEDFYMNLNPIGFNYIGDYDGKKTHFGFGAHKTEDLLESEGYDADKFAVVTHRPLVQEDIEKRFGKDVEVDIETEYGISYTEFIALNTHMIQKTRRELTKVKQEKANLEARLQAIEVKLGL
jgi:hypothetical protein